MQYGKVHTYRCACCIATTVPIQLYALRYPTQMCMEAWASFRMEVTAKEMDVGTCQASGKRGIRYRRGGETVGCLSRAQMDGKTALSVCPYQYDTCRIARHMQLHARASTNTLPYAATLTYHLSPLTLSNCPNRRDM